MQSYDPTSTWLPHIILPPPSPKTKGVLIIPTVFPSVFLIGPTAEEVEEREDPPNDQKTLDALLSAGVAMIPSLMARAKVVGSYAGIRPATEHKDYQISIDREMNWITCGGIRSTGLTSCLGVADYVKDNVETLLGLPTEREGHPFDEVQDYANISRALHSAPKPRADTFEWKGIRYQITHPVTRFGRKAIVGSTGARL
eukprot:TRINITY_DN2046_c0_g2_i1.p1 TRINITY_DN2046_c0_g2~~TRINITY_DN2046_c0_g2_i1.p1  ORF type:complete len:199 (+),score=18.41 TRINITY_DN2046_c0_g2_i1:618-1214(+)